MVRRELALVDGIDDEYRAKVLAQVIECDDFDRDMNVTEHTPYTTVVHRDLSINNIMVLKGTHIQIQIRLYTDWSGLFWKTLKMKHTTFSYT